MKTITKHRQVEQLYGGHLVRSGAAMAESNQATAFDQSHKTFRYGVETS